MKYVTVCLVMIMHGVLRGEAPTIDFNHDVRPILADKCYFCHGPDDGHRKAELRFDLEDSAKEFAIVPGEPQDSELVLRITDADPKSRMPPADSGKSLTEREIETLKNWIAAGANWAEPWSYVPPRHVDPPLGDGHWSRNWIDRFIKNRLSQEGLEPSSDADLVTLMRRVSFDLTGLPPTPEEVEQFVRDPSEQAYERLVDRLLDSPRYGERMAMYWLDLVRYADSVGYHGDQEHNISPYRDYVIGAFNANKPFDVFTHEQLAGDLLPDATLEQRLATGYNRVLQTSHEGGVQAREYIAIYAADRVRNLSAVWMAATVGCAQCHDHKYDPYTSRDFYSLAAFFADIDDAQHLTNDAGLNKVVTRRFPEIDVQTAEESREIVRIEREIAQLESLEAPHESETEKQLETLRAQLSAVRSHVRKCMVTVAIPPRVTRILARGSFLDESGEVVQPAIPDFLGKLNVGDRRANRLDLARWLTDPDGAGGLTARIMVNRFWYLCFGHGISDILDDFGGQGAAPENPELLDQLALEFLESGWDMKHMMRLLTTSRTYRQSSLESPESRAADPTNRWWGRQSRFRLQAEMIHDNALTIGGLLVNQVGGRSSRPYQPAGYYENLNFPQRTYEPDMDELQWRRGVYVHWQRQFLHPMLKAFDAPNREECTAQRSPSNTPLAALVLMNDPTFVEASRKFAVRIVRDGGPDFDSRLHFAFMLAVSHPPSDSQRKLLKSFFEFNQESFRESAGAAEELTSVGLAERDDIPVVELATWTVVARTILNMSETNTRN